MDISQKVMLSMSIGLCKFCVQCAVLVLNKIRCRGNIPENKIEKGESIISYLRPFPPKGTGYHRHIFILYKQERTIDFSKFKKEAPW